MNKKIVGILVFSLVITIMINPICFPVLNAKSIQQIETLKNKEIVEEEYTCYAFCSLKIDGEGEYFWLPIWGTTFGVIGNVSIKALFSFDLATYKIIKFNDGCSLNGNYAILTKCFIGTKSMDNGNLHADGFCLVACPAGPECYL